MPFLLLCLPGGRNVFSKVSSILKDPFADPDADLNHHQNFIISELDHV